MTKPMSRPCTCGGRNPTCFKCGGWGYVGGGGISKQPSAPTKTRPTVLCHICGAPVQRLRKHIRKVHGEIVSAESSEINTVVSETESKDPFCKVCGEKVTIKALEGHMRVRHSIELASEFLLTIPPPHTEDSPE